MRVDTSTIAKSRYARDWCGHKREQYFTIRRHGLTAILLAHRLNWSKKGEGIRQDLPGIGVSPVLMWRLPIHLIRLSWLFLGADHEKVRVCDIYAHLDRFSIVGRSKSHRRGIERTVGLPRVLPSSAFLTTIIA